ncbi:hypothetical protein PI124_g23590 [Phytophthora idaei]|nr:hypothetical protein PI125_g25756 [Phytophthora idaei]KAG3123674.1 hypothetical protein PI126_g23607 [Phytophthora idaei]KAG3231314.1 hypothetical protein PI124_g23590 [Phytophthora idaei]
MIRWRSVMEYKLAETKLLEEEAMTPRTDQTAAATTVSNF